jgi:hypothetical protein
MLDFAAGGCWGVADDHRSSDARIPSSSGTVQKRQPRARKPSMIPGSDDGAAQRAVEPQAQPHGRSSGIADRVALARIHVVA